MSTYERGDYVKVELAGEAAGIGEWMWVRVRSCDDAKRLVFGALDHVPVNDYGMTRFVSIGKQLISM